MVGNLHLHEPPTISTREQDLLTLFARHTVARHNGHTVSVPDATAGTGRAVPAAVSDYQPDFARWFRQHHGLDCARLAAAADGNRVRHPAEELRKAGPVHRIQ